MIPILATLDSRASAAAVKRGSAHDSYEKDSEHDNNPIRLWILQRGNP